MKIINTLKKALIQVMAIISLPFSGHSIPVTLNEALKKYQEGVVEDRCKIIDVDREVLWKTALVFYKSSPKEHLYRPLNVMFEGMENAIDAGALSLEFFADLMRTINNNLFEGNAGCRVPQYSWENVYLIKMAGVMRGSSLHLILHSAVQIYEFHIFIVSLTWNSRFLQKLALYTIKSKLTR